MKMIIKSALVAGVATLAVTTAFAKGGGGDKAVHDIHYSSKVVFTNDNAGVDTSASATAQVSESINGNSDHESLTVTAKGLTAGGSYSLIATTTEDGTNSVGDVDDFTASKSGTAKLTLKNTGSGKKSPTLPSQLDPLTGLTELDIQNDDDTNAGPVTVLTADLTTPQTFTFMDKLSAATGPDGETGTLTVSASNKGDKLTLTAAGLQDSADYTLVLTGGTTASNATFTSTSKGTLKASTPITANVLDLTEVDLTDSTSTVILAFPLP